MKKYIIYFIGIIALSSTLQSCSDYLEESNPNSVSADVYWSDLEESDANLTSVYGSMLNHFIWFFDIDSWRSDLAFPKSRIQVYTDATPWYYQNFSSNNKEVGQRWDAIYQVIWRTNQVIEGLNNMDEKYKSDVRWTEQMGQARFFRGLGHYYLNLSYNNGKVIIRDKVPGNSAEFSKALSTSEEVMKFYRDDLKYAYDNLPNKFDSKTRVTKGTAAFILGQSYLYSKEYLLAMDYLDEVINNSEFGYNLLEGEQSKLLFTSAGDFNSESIFEINYSAQQQIEETQWDEESFNNRWARFSGPSVNTIGGSAYFVPSAWLTNAYSKESLDTNDSRNYVSDGSGGVKLRNVSLRASQMVALVNDEYAEYYKEPAANIKWTFGGTIFSIFKKFTNHDIVASEFDIADSAWKSGKNVVVYRLADAYLMLAECKLKQNSDVDGAVTLINKIRKRWALTQLDAVDFTETTLMEHLMYVERPLELGLEGFDTRTIDLRRWGVTKQRFQNLAALDFNLIDYTTNAGEKRAASLIQPGLSSDPSNNKITIKEYTEAAANYNESLHAYFPLPLSEVLNNQNLGN